MKSFRSVPFRSVSALGLGSVLMAFPIAADASTFVVTAYGDSGVYDGVCSPPPWTISADCTLREAIQEANANPGSDTVEIDAVNIGEPGFAGLIFLDRAGPVDDSNLFGDLDVYDSVAGSTLTIEGGNIDLDAINLGSERILHSVPTAGATHAVDLVLNDLRFRYGTETASPGGCLYAEEGHVALTNSFFRECSAELPGTYSLSSLGGGALAALGGLDLEVVSFEDNTMTNGNGGGVYVTGEFFVDGAVATDNSALTNGSGGAIFWSGTGDFADISGITVENSYAAGPGGGLYLRDASGTVAIADSIIRDNSNAASTGGAYGGGIWLYADSISFSEVRVDGNQGSRGGGLYIIPGAGAGSTNLFMDRCSIINNEATMDGGGFFLHGLGGTSTGVNIVRNSTIGHNISNSGTFVPPGNPGAAFKVASGALGSTGTSVFTVRLQHSTVAVNTDVGTISSRSVDVLAAGLVVEFENSIMEGLCEASGVPPGSYVSLGSNIFNSGASCPVTASDSTPFPYGTSLWNAAPSLIAAALPYYDNSGVGSSIDNGTCASGVIEDQTGAARPTGAGLCDAGSFEQ